MSESKLNETRQTEESAVAKPQADPVAGANERKHDLRDTRRWWIKLCLQPALLLACGVLVIFGLGIAQRLGFISAGGSGGQGHVGARDENVRYICPMMCTPPQSEPGRCPVCAMELVPTTSGGGNADPNSIQIGPAARRVANIRTVAVTSMPMTRAIRTIGELSYDEGTLKTLSAYVDGRVERLYADYTGVEVKKGDQLALVYSPRLYTAQVALLLAKKAHEESRSAPTTHTNSFSSDLYEGSKRQLIELGMTAPQIEQLEHSGEENSRMHLCAPISGTVIEKFVVEGQYVKEGQAIYKLAELSTVWLMLEMFPEDAATMRYGQRIEATVQSLPGRAFNGRVAFIDPSVDPKTRTVGVRVVIPNPGGRLRVGDYAKATIDVPLGSSVDQPGGIYDPELADKWISPRHPQVVESSAGKCRICGVDLVPAARFGFTAEATFSGEALVVPRDAVLMAGNSSVVYVETEPGRFEIRRVVLGPNCGDQIVIVSGVKKGEQVATRGNFLIDSQMQLAGNPSLIDPTKAQPKFDPATPMEVLTALTSLSTEDRGIAERQRICPVTRMRLGSMGAPKKVDVNGAQIFICCEGCRKSLLDDPQRFLANLAAANAADESPEGGPQMDLPPIGVPEIVDPQMGVPPIERPQMVGDQAKDGPPVRDDSKKRAAGPRREIDR